MASIVPGYEFDIFISYRQKDNRGERWVSEFVDALKTELDSTFKEEISVYFDINPHDGLLETHDVDASLKEKIKCLIFIPVISRTYCDPKSFAWEHEFKAFIEQASPDQFGLKVKLPNGNVANRILPVLIHDLNDVDIKLCESVIGGPIRGVEFIYKSAGVNRPLRSKEDSPGDNLNKTFYRNQINKVALAINEIVPGLQPEAIAYVKEADNIRDPQDEADNEEKRIVIKKSAKSDERRILTGVAILAILIFAIFLIFPRIFKTDKLENLRSSDGRITVAVMPFQNITNDTLWNVWQEGIQNNLIASLSNTEELKVRQIESITGLLQSKGLTNYSSLTPSAASIVSQKLKANVIICGSINQAGSTIRVNAQLINSKTEETFKSFQIDGTAGNILHITDSLSWMVKNFLIISKLKNEVTADFQQLASTNSPEAYRYFIHGDKAFWKRDYPAAVKFYSQAEAIDSNFTMTTIMLSVAYGDQGLYDQARKWCLRAYSKRDQMPMKQKIFTNWIYAQYFETPFEKIKYINQLLEFDDQLPILYYQLALIYNELFQYDKAIPEAEKALEIYERWDLKPKVVNIFTVLGIAYHETAQFNKEKKLYRKANQDFPDNPEITRREAILSLTEGDTLSANQYLDKYRYFLKENSESDAGIIANLASVYYETGILDKAEELYRQALSIQPQNAERMNTLAWVLIDNDRNINEGMELIDKALASDPDNYKFIDTKGWGLYKLGKSEEALKLLERSWDLKPIYNHVIYLHIREVKNGLAVKK